MALDASIVALIRDEIGDDTDFTDSELETIYVDENRGNYSALITALIVWKRRQFNLQTRSFDVSTGGTLLSRNQRIKFIASQITRLEALADETHRGTNMAIAYYQDSNYSDTGGEF